MEIGGRFAFLVYWFIGLDSKALAVLCSTICDTVTPREPDPSIQFVNLLTALESFGFHTSICQSDGEQIMKLRSFYTSTNLGTFPLSYLLLPALDREGALCTLIHQCWPQFQNFLLC